MRTEQCRHFGAGQGVAVDVVDKEQHVATLAAVLAHFIAEEFSHGETGQRDAQAVARRLVHLAVHHRDLGVGERLPVDDAGLHHLVIEVVALTGALADAGEPDSPLYCLAMLLISSSMLTVLPTPAPPEQADLTALRKRHQQIDT